jgi:hypothetical protein
MEMGEYCAKWLKTSMLTKGDNNALKNNNWNFLKK